MTLIPTLLLLLTSWSAPRVVYISIRYRSLQGTDYEISCPLSMRPPNPTTALWGYLPAPYVAVSVSTTKAGDGSMLELSVNLEGTHHPYMYAAEGLAQLEKVMGVDGGGDREESAASQGEAEGYAQSRTAKNLRMRATEDVISASIVEGTEEATNDQGLAIPGSLENLPGVLEDIPKIETSPDENLWFMALDMNDRCRFQQPDDDYDPCGCLWYTLGGADGVCGRCGHDRLWHRPGPGEGRSHINGSNTENFARHEIISLRSL